MASTMAAPSCRSLRRPTRGRWRAAQWRLGRWAGGQVARCLERQRRGLGSDERCVGALLRIVLTTFSYVYRDTSDPGLERQ